MHGVTTLKIKSFLVKVKGVALNEKKLSCINILISVLG